MVSHTDSPETRGKSGGGICPGLVLRQVKWVDFWIVPNATGRAGSPMESACYCLSPRAAVPASDLLNQKLCRWNQLSIF